ncbi:FtsX-like permease family protein [Sporosarcina sp. ANT_H38]|uniref:FtsX-like permease family protein n=1 Tax=Sporosarcina sp. ANT_H38 TaxID=2597358 RepID=UPI0011F23212|nr:ABC transporter permease [Sporosarcina sp. ANT_H38]KAA0964810.1 FtsX-like permease family protein [Sporosarcina sp. ANT_H38]
MTLFDIALKNIRRNLKSYSLYIGSTIFSIIIYFTFVTLKYSEDIQSLAEASKQIKGIMSVAAFVLMIFVAIFIVYSNSFFMKKRKKEVALYSLLGVRKRSIGSLLFFENMVIGILSLAVGIGLGFLSSQGLLTILVSLMGLDIDIGFAFSINAVMNTLIVFFIIFLFTSLQGYRVIYQFKLIDLFHASQKGEELPKARIIAVFLGVLMVTAAYWLALQDLMTSDIWRKLGLAMPLVIIALTVIGTYLLFHSVLVYVLSTMKKQERWAWKGLNLMTVSQLLYRIRGNAKTLTIIAILSATTITSGGAVFGIYYNAEKNVLTDSPYTFMWEGTPQDIDPEIIEREAIIKSKTLRVVTDEQEMEYAVINQSTFERLAKDLEWSDIQPFTQDEIVMIDASYDERWSQKNDSVTIEGTKYEVAKLYDLAILNTMTFGASAIVVSDQLFNEINEVEKTYHAVQVKAFKSQLALSNKLAMSTENFSSATQNYKDSIQAFGSLLFVGSFLGLVFLIATGSIIFFKVMTEAEEDKEKYMILRKIGVSNKEMKRTIRGQIGIVFTIPLILGISHGAVALTAFSSLLNMDFLVPVIIWMVAYAMIYSIYYFVSVRSIHKLIQ